MDGDGGSGQRATNSPGRRSLPRTSRRNADQGWGWERSDLQKAEIAKARWCPDRPLSDWFAGRMAEWIAFFFLPAAVSHRVTQQDHPAREGCCDLAELNESLCGGAEKMTVTFPCFSPAQRVPPTQTPVHPSSPVPLRCRLTALVTMSSRTWRFFGAKNPLGAPCKGGVHRGQKEKNKEQ